MKFKYLINMKDFRNLLTIKPQKPAKKKKGGIQYAVVLLL